MSYDDLLKQNHSCGYPVGKHTQGDGCSCCDSHVPGVEIEDKEAKYFSFKSVCKDPISKAVYDLLTA